MTKIFNTLFKLGLIAVFMYFIQKEDIIGHILKIINNKYTLKETFNNIILPKDKAIKIKIEDQLPLMRFGLMQKDNYSNEFGKYFKRNIFPIVPLNNKGCLKNIVDLINNNIDLALVDEETLTNFIKNHIHIRSNLKVKKLPKINFSLIGVCFYQSFLFITFRNSGIFTYNDIKTKKYDRDMPNVRIGILNKNYSDYYHFLRLIYLSDISYKDDIQINVFENYDELKEAFINEEIDVIYLTTNKKNQFLFDISKEKNIRFIAPNYIREIQRYNDTKSYDPFVINFPFPPFIHNNLINNNNNNNNNNDINKNYDRIFSSDTLFFVSSRDYYEFKECLSICKKFIPDTNSFKNIIKNQTTIFIDSNINNIKGEFRDSNSQFSVLFLSGNQQRRQLLLSGLDDYQSNYIGIHENNKFLLYRELEAAEKLRKYKDFNSLIKNRFNIVFDETINLSTGYNNINQAEKIKTYSTRMLLVARNKIEKKYIEQIAENFIQELDNLKVNINDYLNMQDENLKNDENLQNQLKKDKDSILKIIDPYFSKAFEFQELISVKDIPIHKKAKHIYEKYGLLKRVTISQSNVN